MRKKIFILLLFAFSAAIQAAPAALPPSEFNPGKYAANIGGVPGKSVSLNKKA